MNDTMALKLDVEGKKGRIKREQHHEIVEKNPPKSH